MKESTSLAMRFVSCLREVLGDSSSLIALHEPEFNGNEWSYVKDCLDSRWVSSAGRYVDKFEELLAEYTGARHAVAVINGSAALHLALKVSGVNAGDEVIIPALTFVATANAVVHCGSIPHFVDSNLNTLGMDAEFLASYLNDCAETTSNGLRNKKTGRRIAALIPMHTFGHPVEIDSLVDLAARYNLPLVEDAAEALGSTYRGKHAGTFGKIGVLSFNGNKVITTGGGGAILTNDLTIARQAKHLSTTAKITHKWEFYHDSVGYNYRLPNINSALGCAQIEQLPDFLTRKRMLAERYRSSFINQNGMKFIDEPKDCHSNFWLNAISISSPDFDCRDEIIKMADAMGYQCRPVWKLLNKLPMYKSCPHSDLNGAELLERSLINIPSSSRLIY